ncbi:MAG: CRISPR-associated protein Cas4 [Lachnospiraceae bacterium]
MEDEYLLLSGIQHFAFCRRQWALIHIEQQWQENYQTTSGELLHKKAHDDTAIEKRGDLLITRGMRIVSASLGITGECDVVEFHKDPDGISIFGYDGKWKVVPVEYKNGKPKEGSEDELQLCAQAYCLEEMLQTEIPEGYLYYGQPKRRTKVIFTEKLRQKLIDDCAEMHQYFRRGYTPKVKTSKKCRSCSLAEVCLPKMQEKLNVKEYIQKSLAQEIEE